MKKFALLALVMLSVKSFALEVGDFAPCVVLDDIQVSGKVIEQCIRTPFKKGQYVILDFFSPKCDDCVENLDKLGALAGDVASKATTRMVGSHKNKTEVLSFLEEHKSKVSVPVSLDTELQAMRTYGVNAVPTLFVLNNKNFIVFKHTGPVTETVAAAIKKILK